MTNNEFKQVLLDDSVLMSKQELEEIIENELNKSESEMDADLIEYCLDNIKKLQLSEEGNKKEESKKVFFINPKMWRVLVAMSVVLTFIFAVTASAIYFNIPENIAQLINGNAEFDMNLENADTTESEYIVQFYGLTSNSLEGTTLVTIYCNKTSYEIKKIICTDHLGEETALFDSSQEPGDSQ